MSMFIEEKTEQVMGVLVSKSVLPQGDYTMELMESWEKRIKNKAADDQEQEMIRLATNNRKPLVLKEIINDFIEKS